VRPKPRDGVLSDVRPGRCLVALGASLALAGCGEPSLQGSDARGLPLVEYEMQNLCPGKSDIRGNEARRLRRDAQAKLVVLLTEYRRDPDATVRVGYTAADLPGTQYRTVSMRSLVERNLAGLQRTSCDPAAQAELTAVLDGG